MTTPSPRRLAALFARQRRRVFAAHGGICNECGRDTVADHADYWVWRRSVTRSNWPAPKIADRAVRDLLLARLAELGIPLGSERGPWWEPDGDRSLCLRCATAVKAARVDRIMARVVGTVEMVGYEWSAETAAIAFPTGHSPG